ncbi:phosphotransferase [Halobacillus sp. B29]|uniref:phosphotransferase n=1 Tax=Halobacillus sp. B29 TaxID=3457432 RepID=UPI003FCDAA89
MKVEHTEGDSYTDRLFQWLLQEEKLPIRLEKVIKPKVYKVRYNGQPMILKGYRRAQTLEQQISFFQDWNYASIAAARPLPFQDNIYTKSKLGCAWGLFEWIQGKHADFDNHYDREKAVQVLHQFHRTTKGIATLAIPRDPLYIKWERRLEQFEETQDIFSEYRKRSVYQELRLNMIIQLERFSNHPWGEVEEKAWENNEWLHGDVAHHNFIINNKNEIKLIDFDLLHTGPHLYDHIQLGQRFLPYLENQRALLLQYFKHTPDPEIWLKGVLVPADILREWLYGYRRCLRGEVSLSKHIKKLEKAWEGRKKFVRYAEHMLR